MNDGGHGETETLQMPEEITKGEAEIRAWLTSRGVRIPENRIELITTLYADGATIPAEIGNLVNLETLYASDAYAYSPEAIAALIKRIRDGK